MDGHREMAVLQEPCLTEKYKSREEKCEQFQHFIFNNPGGEAQIFIQEFLPVVSLVFSKCLFPT